MIRPMGKKPLRAGMSGCGGISQVSLTAAGRSATFDVVAIQEPNAERLARTSLRFGIDRRH